MDRTIQKALYVILVSFGLALVFNFLFFDRLIGISVFIFTLVLLGVLFLVGLREQVSFKKRWWLMSPILFFALMPGIHANEFLTFLNICAALGLLMVLAFDFAGTPAFLMRLRDYLLLLVVVPFRMLRRGLSTFSLLDRIHGNEKHRDLFIRILKGIVMAVPALLIFGLLFSQADLAFSRFVKNFVDISISPHSAWYIVLLVFAFVAALSFLSYIFFPKEAKLAPSLGQADGEALPGKGVEALTFLSLISILFFVFIVFQITYLFGGETNIVNAGFTYAEYARRGFWELLAVAMLSLLVLLASEKYARAESRRDWRFFGPALVLTAEVVVIIVSAFKRLSLYIDAYGMTELRFYVAGFIILLFVLFVLLAVKFIKSKSEHFFAFGALLSVITFLVVVNLINPDAFIAKSNIEQYSRTGKVDAFYVGGLSSDAEVRKIELYKKLQGEDKESLGRLLESEKGNLREDGSDWRSVNFSRSKALKLLQDF